MSYQSSYTRGLWLVICEACGRQYKNTQLRQRWDGFMVCEDDWEPRQPQDFVRGVADYQAPPWTRPEQEDVFEPVTIIYDPWGESILQPLTLVNKISLLVSRIIAKPILSATSTNTSTLNTLYIKKPRAINTYSLDTTIIG